MSRAQRPSNDPVSDPAERSARGTVGGLHTPPLPDHPKGSARGTHR